MAWCFVKAEELEKAIADGKLYSFRTLDLSPKAGYEWLMHGASTLRERLGPNSIDQIKIISRFHAHFKFVCSALPTEARPEASREGAFSKKVTPKSHQSHSDVIFTTKSLQSHPNVTPMSSHSCIKVGPQSSQCHPKVTP